MDPLWGLPPRDEVQDAHTFYINFFDVISAVRPWDAVSVGGPGKAGKAFISKARCLFGCEIAICLFTLPKLLRGGLSVCLCLLCMLHSCKHIHSVVLKAASLGTKHQVVLFNSTFIIPTFYTVTPLLETR